MADKRRSSQDHSRTKLAQGQTHLLNEFYRLNPRPSNGERIFLAKKLGIRLDKIKNWFQNRRAKEKKEGHESPCLEYRAIACESKRRYPSIFPNCSDLYRRRSP